MEGVKVVVVRADIEGATHGPCLHTAIERIAKFFLHNVVVTVPLFVGCAIVIAERTKFSTTFIPDLAVVGIVPCIEQGIGDHFHVFVAEVIDGTIGVGIVVGGGIGATVG